MPMLAWILPFALMLLIPIEDQLGYGGSLPAHWQAPLSPLPARVQALDTYNGNLYLIHGAEGTLSVRRIPLTPLGPDISEDITFVGLPSAAALVSFCINPAVSKAYAALATDSGTELYVSPVSPDGTFGDWTPHSLPPLAPEEVIVRLFPMDEYLLVLTEVRRDNFGGLGGWSCHGLLEQEAIEWARLPETDDLLSGHDYARVAGMLLVVGGTRSLPGGEKESSNFPLSLTFSPPEHGPWKALTSLPQSTRFSDVSAVGSEAGIAVLRAPTSTSDDSTTMTLMMSRSMRHGRFTPWREYRLDQLESERAALLLDAASSSLLVYAEDAEGGLHLSAYPVPAWAQQEPATPNQLMRAHLGDNIPELPEVSIEDLKQRIAEQNGFGLVIVTSNEDDEMQAAIKTLTTKYRYMTMGAETTHIGGNEGAALLSQYGLTGTPAYLLINAKGELLASHVGSIPNSQETFRLTSPTRRAKPTPTATEAGEGG